MRGEKGGEERGIKGKGGLNPETDRQSFEEEEGGERGIRVMKDETGGEGTEGWKGREKHSEG